MKFDSDYVVWDDGIPDFDEGANTQIKRLASLPFTQRLAIMPDCHMGYGVPIGAVIPTVGAIIPAAVGLDIGCGMMAARLDISAGSLPDNLSRIRADIESAVPHGRTDNGGRNDVGGWDVDQIPVATLKAWNRFAPSYNNIITKHPRAQAFNTITHLGTLGTGNHFIEICIDETEGVWIMLHSGSRGLGAKIGNYFIGLAKKDMERWFIQLPDKDLAYHVEGSELFDDYFEALNFAQDFALRNRELMMDAVLVAIQSSLPHVNILPGSLAINCHHNYARREHHFKANPIITRKGAISARLGELGIIPGSMGDKSFIVTGKGNKLSYTSCSHGAGRVMSRTQARKEISIDSHVFRTDGVECRKDESVLDESPAAYKNIDDVMAAQTDLVDILHTLKQVICVKG